MQRIFSFAFLAVAAVWPMRAQDNILGPDFRRQSGGRGYDILAAVKPWDLLGQGYQLTGDSAVDRDGNVFFTDSRTNRILKIDLAGKISTWKEGTNGAHGIAYGRMAACTPASTNGRDSSLSLAMARNR